MKNIFAIFKKFRDRTSKQLQYRVTSIMTEVITVLYRNTEQKYVERTILGIKKLSNNVNFLSF